MPRRQHILIADDDPVTVQMVSGVLKENGFDVSVAVDAMQAVMMAMRKPPDAGAKDFLKKPVAPDQLLQALDRVLMSFEDEEPAS